MFSVAICDDDEKLCFKIEDIIAKYGKKTSKMIKTEVFFSGEELYKYMKDGEFFDLVFLDIEMEPISGVETGLLIRQELHNNEIQIVFISSHSEYAVDLFQIRPMDFLIKPLTSQRIIGTVETYLNIFEKSMKTFQYHMKHQTYKVLISTILYFSSNDREVSVHFTDGKVDTFYGSLDAIYKQLHQYKFIRSHRSFLVHYDKIVVFMKDTVQMVNGQLLPVSRKKKREIIELRKLLEKE